MPRHPFFLLLCGASLSYLLWADARGYTPFYLSKPGSRAPGMGHGSGAHRFFHK